MYDYQSRLTVAHSVNEQRLAEVRRSHLLREAQDARSAARTERVQATTGHGLFRRVRSVIDAVAHAAPTAHAAGVR
jgi:hypothetical protein